MKKLTFTLICTLSIVLQIQAQKSQVNLFSDTPYTTYTGVVEGGDLKYEQVKGTPYTNDSFQEATLVGDSIGYLIRYDAYKQVMQLREKDYHGEAKILQPTKSYRFDLVGKNQSYIAVTYPSLGKGFGLVIWNNNTGVELIKRQVVTFQKGRKGNGGYQVEIADAFSEIKESYFIRLSKDEKLIEIPSSKKEVFKFLGDEIKKKAKENKLNPNKEEDLIQLISFKYGTSE
ncbi:hypothetical protein [Bernardetia sp.]|uniref:hypothetical protein n=1 Tax=Bernardetia sp. TaxID=1937974 RepID=UPI0025BC4498|nr:hypothetical protein [Bernardetia sp.]